MERRDYRRLDWVKDGYYDAGIVRVGRTGIPGYLVIIGFILLAATTCGGAGIAAAVLGHTHIVHWIPALALAGVPLVLLVVCGISALIKTIYRGIRNEVHNATKRLENPRHRSSYYSY